MAAEEIPDLRYGGEMVLPQRDSYSYTPPYGANRSDIAGTLSRLNRATFGGPAEVSCTVQLNSLAKLQWWDDFYNYTIAEGSKRFNMQLFVNGIIQSHVCQIVAVPKVTTSGFFGTVELSLQAVPIFNRCAAMSRQVMMPCYGDKTNSIVTALADLGPLLNNARFNHYDGEFTYNADINYDYTTTWSLQKHRG